MNIKERKQCNPIEHVILPSSVVSVFDVLVVGHVCGPQDVGEVLYPKKKVKNAFLLPQGSSSSISLSFHVSF
jgi:hypothetical protein